MTRTLQPSDSLALRRALPVLVGLLMILLQPSLLLADASRWTESLKADATIEISSLGELDRSLRSLSQRAELDWLPTVRRLLLATRLLPGADLHRPMTIALFAPVDHEDEEANGSGFGFVTIIPAAQPRELASNYLAEPSSDHPDLLRFRFADRNYHARVLDDEHLAMSDDPKRLHQLRIGEPQSESLPTLRITFRSERGSDLIRDAARAMGLTQLPLDSLPSTSESVERVRIDLWIGADEQKLELTLTAAPQHDNRSLWMSTPSNLGRMPFPGLDYIALVQMDSTHPFARDLIAEQLADLIGLSSEALAQTRSVSAMFGGSGPLIGGDGFGITLSIETQDTRAFRSLLASSIRSIPGGAYSENASQLVGVSLDRWSIRLNNNQTGAPASANATSRGLAILGGGIPTGSNQTASGTVFERGDHVVFTNARGGDGLNRLVAFGPDTRSVEDGDELRRMLAQLPQDALARAAIDVRAISVLTLAGLSFQGIRVNIPENLSPAVASLHTDEGELHATIVIPTSVLLLLERIRRETSQIGTGR